MFRNESLPNRRELKTCQLKAVRDLYPEVDPILLDVRLEVEIRGRFVIFRVQQVIDASGDLQVFGKEVLAKEGQIDDGITGGIWAGNNGGAWSKGIDLRFALAGVLNFQAGENLIFVERGINVEFNHIFR